MLQPHARDRLAAAAGTSTRQIIPPKQSASSSTPAAARQSHMRATGPPPAAATLTDDRAAQAAERISRQHDALDEILALGTGLARLVHDRAQAQEAVTPPESPAQPAASAVPAFDRLSRTIRLSIMLSHRIDDPAVAAQHRTARRRIVRAVEDRIERAEKDPEQREHLRLELLERLDGPDLEDEIGNRPTNEIIAELYADLGIEHAMPGMPPPKRRTPADIARLCTRAVTPRRIQPLPDPVNDQTIPGITAPNTG